MAALKKRPFIFPLMANNIIANAPNAVVAKAEVSFVDAGLTADNTEIIYEIGAAIKSWKPGRPINGITGFETDKGYYLVAKQAMDLTAIVVPPVSGGAGSQLATPGNFNANTASSAQINLSWDAVGSATSYTLQRATLSDYSNATNIYTGALLFYNDNGLSASTTYFYRVRATASGFLASNYATDSAATSSGSSFDSNAQAFFDAAVITDSTQRNALNQLILDWKSAGIYAKGLFAYPFLGGTAAKHKYNVFSPTDDDAGYRLLFTGSPTHDANGVTFNGTSQYANTKMVPNGAGLDNTTGMCIAFYSRTDLVTAGYLMGAYPNDYIDFESSAVLAAVNSPYINMNTGGGVSIKGTHIFNRAPGGANIRYLKDGTLIGNEAQAVNNPASTEFLIGAISDAGTLYYGAGNIAFAAAFSGLNTTQETALYNSILAYETTLGRLAP